MEKLDGIGVGMTESQIRRVIPGVSSDIRRLHGQGTCPFECGGVGAHAIQSVVGQASFTPI